MNASAAGLVPVHIGQPESEPDAERRASPRQRDRPVRVPAGLDWQRHGVEPRWLGMDTSDCPVAVQPSVFHNHGADELTRLLAGTRQRGEPALVVAVMGNLADDGPRHPLASHDASVGVATRCTRASQARYRRVPAVA